MFLQEDKNNAKVDQCKVVMQVEALSPRKVQERMCFFNSLNDAAHIRYILEVVELCIVITSSFRSFIYSFMLQSQHSEEELRL